VQYQLVIPQSPVVTYALFAVDYERINAEHLQSGGRGETALTSTCDRVR
jgi:hypothetical protein